MSPGRSAAVLAHQGGWDEILLVVGPIALIVALLMIARQRLGHTSPDSSQPGND